MTKLALLMLVLQTDIHNSVCLVVLTTLHELINQSLLVDELCYLHIQLKCCNETDVDVFEYYYNCNIVVYQ